MDSNILKFLEDDLLSTSITLKEKINNTTKFFDNELSIKNRAYEVIETIRKYDICKTAQTELDKFWYNFVKNNSRKTINMSNIDNKLKKISKSARVNLLLGLIKDDNKFIEEVKIINLMSNNSSDLSWEDIWNLTIKKETGSKDELLKAVKIVNSNDLFEELSFGSNIDELLHELQLNIKNDYTRKETIDFVEKVKSVINLLLQYQNECTSDLEEMCLKLQKKILFVNDTSYNINVKNIDFALDSVIRNHHGNMLNLTDLIWCDLILNNIHDMDKIIYDLLDYNNEYNFFVKEIIDNFDFSKSAISQNGYRYIRLELVNKNSGIICELRLHIKEMYELKENLNIKYGYDINLLSQSFVNEGIFMFTRILERIDIPVRYQLCENYIQEILKYHSHSEDSFNEFDLIKILHYLGSILCDLRLYEESKNILFKTCDIIKNIGGSDIELARTLYILASCNIKTELFNETDEQFRLIKELIEKNFGSNHIEILSTIRNKAVILFKQNKLDKATSEFLFILRISEKIFGPDHIQVGIILSELSLIYCEKKNYSEALSMAKNALDIFKEKLGTTHMYYLKIEYTITLIYERQGNLKDALSWCNNCVKKFITIFGTEHEHSSILLSQKARIQINLELYQDALDSLDTVYKINQRIYGLNDSKSIISLLNLANGLYFASNIEKALDLYNYALIIQENKLGSNNINIADNLLNIGIILIKDKKYLESITILEKALEIYQINNIYGINYGNTLLNLILTYLNLNNDVKAQIFIKKSYDIFKKILNSKINLEEYKNILNMLTMGLIKIAYIYKNNSNFDSSLDILEYTLKLNEDDIKIKNECSNINSQDLPKILVCIGSIHSQLNNIDNAIYNYRKALYIWLPIKKNNYETRRTLHSLAKLYENKYDWKKAEETYNTILIFQNEMFGKKSNEVALTFEKIAICCLNLNNPNEALLAFNNSLEIRNELYSNAVKNNESVLETKSILLTNVARTNFLIGNVYSELNNNDNAIEFYKSSITAYEALGTVLVCQKRYMEAINLYQRELRIKNNIDNINKIKAKSNLENTYPYKKCRYFSNNSI